jgi:hypothetical protein
LPLLAHPEDFIKSGRFHGEESRIPPSYTLS